MKQLILITATLIFSSISYAKDISITIGHVDPATWTTSKKGAATEVFKNLVEAESNGRIKVNIYPSGQLGSETELVQSAQEGLITMAMVSGAFSKVCPETSVLEIPYLFPSSDIAWKVLDGSFGQKLAENCLKKTGLRTLSYGETGFRHFTNSKRTIKKPSDLEGLKIRVMTTPLYVEMLKALKAQPTPIAFPEVPAALTTGVIDGQENPVSVIVMSKFYELQKYITLDGHVYGADFLLINETFYQSLSTEDKQILNRAATVASTVGRAIQQFNSAEGLSILAQKGMEVTTLSTEELEAFQQATQPAVITWLETQIDKKWITEAQKAVDNATSNL